MVVSIGTSGKHRSDIRLRWRHNKKRYSLCIGKRTSHNLAEAKVKAAQIELDISRGEFDSTLNKYRYDESCTGKPFDIVERFEYWAQNIRGVELESSYYLFYPRLLKSWGNFKIEHIPHLLQLEKYSVSTYNHRLTVLRKFLAWLVKQKYISANPLEGVQSKKHVRKHSLETTARSPLTVGEIWMILDAVKTDRFNHPSSQYTHSHYYPFLYFLFATGVRNAEAIGLRLQHIDFKLGNIEIREVLARTADGNTHASARVRKDTKTHNKRYLPLSADLREILIPLVKDKEPDDLVFTSFTGKAIDDRMLERRVFKPVLAKLGIPDRDLYVARHSFGTRAAQQMMPVTTIASLMGHATIETAIKHYVGLNHVPASMPSMRLSDELAQITKVP